MHIYNNTARALEYSFILQITHVLYFSSFHFITSELKQKCLILLMIDIYRSQFIALSV